MEWDTGQVSSDGERKNENGLPSGSSPRKEDLGGGPGVLTEHGVGGGASKGEGEGSEDKLRDIRVLTRT